MGRNLRLLKCRFPFSRGHVKRATYGLLYLYFRLSLQGARARSKRHTAAPLDLASYSSLCVFSPTERLVQRSQGRSRLGTRLPRPRGCMPPERGGGENRFHLLHLPRTGTYELNLGRLFRLPAISKRLPHMGNKRIVLQAYLKWHINVSQSISNFWIEC